LEFDIYINIFQLSLIEFIACILIRFSPENILALSFCFSFLNPYPLYTINLSCPIYPNRSPAPNFYFALNKIISNFKCIIFQFIIQLFISSVISFTKWNIVMIVLIFLLLFLTFILFNQRRFSFWSRSFIIR
jgi:hypothetical protein